MQNTNRDKTKCKINSLLLYIVLISNMNNNQTVFIYVPFFLNVTNEYFNNYETIFIVI